MSSGGCRGPVKVVIINTQYVETDATSFKSVVQKLTGKDSVSDQLAAEKAQRKKHKQGGLLEAPPPSVVAGGGLGSSFCMRDVSFDRLLSEMPPINDELWSLV